MRLASVLEPEIKRVIDPGNGVVIAHGARLEQAVKILPELSLDGLVRVEEDWEDCSPGWRDSDLFIQRLNITSLGNQQRILRGCQDRRDVFAPLEHSR